MNDQWLAAVDRIVCRIENSLADIAAVFMLILMSYTVLQIVGRGLFDLPVWSWIGIDETVTQIYRTFAFGYIDVVEQMMALFAFVAVAYCDRLGGHVRMDLVIRRFSGRAKWIAEFFAVLVGLVFIGFLVVPAFEHFVRAFELGDSTIDAGLPVWPSKLIVPIALSLLWLRLAISAWGYLRLACWPSQPPMAVAERYKSDLPDDVKAAGALDDELRCGSPDNVISGSQPR